jgi:hypothetical protein
MYLFTVIYGFIFFAFLARAARKREVVPGSRGCHPANSSRQTHGIQDINLREGGNASLEGFLMFKDNRMEV